MFPDYATERNATTRENAIEHSEKAGKRRSPPSPSSPSLYYYTTGEGAGAHWLLSPIRVLSRFAYPFSSYNFSQSHLVISQLPGIERAAICRLDGIGSEESQLLWRFAIFYLDGAEEGAWGGETTGKTQLSHTNHIFPCFLGSTHDLATLYNAKNQCPSLAQLLSLRDFTRRQCIAEQEKGHIHVTEWEKRAWENRESALCLSLALVDLSQVPQPKNLILFKPSARIRSTF